MLSDSLLMIKSMLQNAKIISNRQQDTCLVYLTNTERLDK